jgi:hypothetical protein
MRSKIVLLAVVLAACASSDARADYFNRVWGLQFTDPYSDYGDSLVIDPQGSLLFRGEYNITPSHWDNCVAKYTDQGQAIWKTPSTPSWTERIQGVIGVDSHGNAYIEGYANGPSGGSYYGDWDGFVRKYDSTGNMVWQRQAGTSSFDAWFAGSVNATGDSFVCGTSGGTLAPGAPGSRSDTTIAKYDSAGNLQWIRQYDVAGDDRGMSIISDPSGNVYVGGWANLSTQGFLMKLGPDGSLVWTTQFGPAINADIAGFDAQGNIIFTGETQGALAGASHGGQDIYAGRCDPAGNVSWIGQYGSTGDDVSCHAVLDSKGNVTWVGWSDGSWFGQNQGGYDAYIAGIAADGVLLGGTQFGSTGFDFLSGLSTDGTDWYVTGGTSGSLWGPNTGSAGSYDMILGEFSTTPAPGALLLGGVGVGFVGWLRRRRMV